MSLGVWSGSGPDWRKLLFPGLSLNFTVDDQRGHCMVTVKVLNIRRLWEHIKFRRSGLMKCHFRFDFTYPITLQVVVKDEVISQYEIKEYLYPPYSGARFYIYRMELTRDFSALAARVFTGVVDFEVRGIVDIYALPVRYHANGITFNLEFSFPLDLLVKIFERESRDAFSSYIVWARKVTDYHRLIDELSNLLLEYCNEFVRRIDFRKVFLLPNDWEVLPSIGEPTKEIKLGFDDITCVYPAKDGKVHFVSSSSVTFYIHIPLDVYEKSGLKSLVEGGGDPVEVLSRLVFVITFFPQSFSGSSGEKELFLDVVNALLYGGD